MRRLPISTKLALVAGFATAIFLALVGGGLYLGTKASLDGGIDASLRARATDLRRILDQTPGGVRLSSGPTTFEQLIGAGGEVVGGAEGPALLDPDELTAARRAPIYRWRGERARLYAVAASRGRVLVVGTSIASRERALETLATALLVGVPIASLLAALAALLVARRALLPVQQLRRRAAELAVSENDQGLAIPETHDEVEELARTLDEMLHRLSEARRREREFVANASHQLRTPIAILEAELELALDDTATDEAAMRAAIASAHEEAKRIASLARRLLQLSLADEGALPLDLEPTDLADLLEEAARRFTPRASLAGRRVRFEGGHGVTRCDAERLRDVFDALVDNALVHGAGDVTLSLSSDDESIRVSVADEGSGFPDNSEAEVVRRFVSYGSGSSHAGLGLSLVDAVVRAHGGSVAIGRDGSHAVVEIRLPLTDAFTPTP